MLIGCIVGVSLGPMAARMALDSKEGDTTSELHMHLEWGVTAQYIAFIQSILMNVVRMTSLDLGVRYVIGVLHILCCLKPIPF